MFTAGFIPGFIVAFAMIMTAYLLAPPEAHSLR